MCKEVNKQKPASSQCVIQTCQVKPLHLSASLTSADFSWVQLNSPVAMFKRLEGLKCQQMNRWEFLWLLKTFRRVKCITAELTSQSVCVQGGTLNLQLWEKIVQLISSGRFNITVGLAFLKMQWRIKDNMKEEKGEDKLIPLSCLEGQKAGWEETKPQALSSVWQLFVASLWRH